MKKVLFETHHLYYWANFWPIVEELKKRRNYDIQVSIPKRDSRSEEIQLMDLEISNEAEDQPPEDGEEI